MIELENVSKSFGQQQVLDRFSHAFASGSRTAVTGASGIGKTTLLNAISGLIAIDDGLIRIDGQVTDTPTMRIHPSKRSLGFAFQSPSLWPHLNVRQNILYGMAGPGHPDREQRLLQICEAFAITDLLRQFPGELSGGQARRVSLARTMIVQPKHLLLDEPLNNLDSQLKDKVLSFIRKDCQESGRTLVLITHDPSEAAGVCDLTLGFRPGGLI